MGGAYRVSARTWAARSLPITVLAGLLILLFYAAMPLIFAQRSADIPTFLVLYLLAGGAFLLVVFRLERDNPSPRTVWGFAAAFRLVVLAGAALSGPFLSTDVYRYVWDGHLMNQGVSPYLARVDSPLLDELTIPARALVEHAWMASPYLPVAQFYFGLVTRLAGGATLVGQVWAFQAAAAGLDLLTGWLVMLGLSQAGIPRRAGLIYLWNPLVVVEFATGGHVDALMVCLTTAALALALHRNRAARLSGAVLLALATLVKGLPGLLVPLLARRWGWRGLLLYSGLVALVCAAFAAPAGWGLFGPLDGTGLFGALRIYLSQWNFNFGLPGALEWLAERSPGGEPWAAGLRLLSAGLFLAAWGLGARAAWQAGWIAGEDWRLSNRWLVRAALLPVGAYLLLTPTVHPWYITLALPLLPFFWPGAGEEPVSRRLIWPWAVFSVTVGLSYLYYLNQTWIWVAFVEYLPVYALLVWAGRAAIKRAEIVD